MISMNFLKSKPEAEGVNQIWGEYLKIRKWRIMSVKILGQINNLCVKNLLKNSMRRKGVNLRFLLITLKMVLTPKY